MGPARQIRLGAERVQELLTVELCVQLRSQIARSRARASSNAIDDFA